MSRYVYFYLSVLHMFIFLETVLKIVLTKKDREFIAEQLGEKLFTAIAKAVTVNSYKVNFTDGTNRASTIGGGLCNRKSVLANILDWRHSEYMQYASLTGTLIHYTLQALVRETLKNSDIEGEVRLDMGSEYGLGIIGHYDLLILELRDQSGKEYMVVIDIKTVNDIEPEPFKYHHYNQLQFYLAYLKNMFPQKNVIGALWYVDRNYSDPRILEIINPVNWKFRIVEFSEDDFRSKLIQGKIMKENLGKNILPPPISEYNPYNWMCKPKFCPYVRLCFGNQKINTLTELLDFANMTRDEYESQAISFWSGERAIPKRDT